MSLDPQVEAHYRKQGISAAPASAGFDIASLRRNADLIYNDLKQEPAVFRVSDEVIRCPDHDIPIRIYVPGEGGLYPVMLFFHGGAFIMHNIESHDSLCRNLCLACGAVIVNVGYRLAPEHPFPAALDDASDALEWVYHNASRLNADNSKIALCGDSAGAILSAQLSLLTRDRNGPGIGLQILCYGTGEVSSDKGRETASMKELGHGGYVLTSEFIRYSMDSFAGNADPSNSYLNPIRARDLSSLPKTISINAEYDPLRDDGEYFADKLKAAGNEVIKIRVQGITHGFLLLWREFDKSREIIALIGKLFQETFS